MGRNSDSAIQRLQVGLMGLLVVLLFVTVANMMSKGADGSVAAKAQADLQAGQPNAKDAPVDEPLGELGVTPVVPEKTEKQQPKSAVPANP